MVRVFIDHGDRTNRTKARLKYVLDAWGMEKFVAAVEEKLGRKLVRVPTEALKPRPPVDRTAHIGVHPQKQPGLNWIGVALPVGRMTLRANARPCRRRARARRRRSASHRLAEPADLRALPTKTSPPRKQRSKLSASAPRPTRSAPASSPAPATPAANSRHQTPSAMPMKSRAGARPASPSTRRSTSISPAAITPARSTSISEIGLLACKVQESEDGDPIEGYHILVGGGFGAACRARPRDSIATSRRTDAPRTVERILKAYRGAPRLAAGDLPRLRRPHDDRRAEGAVRGRDRRMTARRRGRRSLQIFPESAPFTPEQRVWLNGFFAGFLGLEQAVTPLSAEEAAALVPGLMATRRRGSRRGRATTTWHDPALPIADRMKLAEGRSLHMRMMAAMAQQDCGQCGSTAKTIRTALSRKQEAAEPLRTGRQGYLAHAQEAVRGNRCRAGRRHGPGGARPHNRALRPPAPPAAPAIIRSPRPSCRAPFSTSRARRRKPGTSSSILSQSGLDYTVGDSFGIIPTNDPALVDAIIRALDAPPDFPIGGRTLRDVLTDGVSLSARARHAVPALSRMSPAATRRQKAKSLAAGDDPDGDAKTLDVLAAIEKFPGIRPDPEAFIEALDPLQPRLYSISSSPKVNAGAFRSRSTRCATRSRSATASASPPPFLPNASQPGDKVKVYIQGAAFRTAERSVGTCDHGRPRHRHRAVPRLPARAHGDQGPRPQLAVLRPSAARLRFLLRGRIRRHEGRRRSHAAVARLVAGRQGASSTSRTACARSGRDFWTWLEDGAHFYVCGAVRMGQDVERALVDIVAEHGDPPDRGDETARRSEKPAAATRPTFTRRLSA